MKSRKEALEYGLSFPDTYKGAPFHDENWILVRIKGSKKAFLWTYEKDGSVLGYAFCALRHQGSGSLRELTSLYVDDICVDEKARGQHVGLSMTPSG